MRQDLVLYTCAGGMKVMYLPQFAAGIPMQVMNTPSVEVAFQTPIFDSPAMEFNPDEIPHVEAFKREVYDLKSFHKVSGYQLLRHPTNSGIALRMEREKARDEATKKIAEEFKIMVAKKQPTFFMKDLTIEKLNDLSEEFMRNFGGEPCGINIKLSPYQQFFAIANYEDFKFYMYEARYHEAFGPDEVIDFRGRLVDLRPDKWVMGRYENLTYMKELSAMRMYQGGTDK